MIRLKINERDGYMVDSDLPHNCIFNKARTGCGATTIAIRNNENYVIAVPTTELIINKCNSERELFGLYGNFTASLKNRLKEYIKTAKQIKIMCTYDKLPKLLEYINANDCRLLVDEYHNLLQSIHSGTRLLMEYWITSRHSNLSVSCLPPRLTQN